MQTKECLPAGRTTCDTPAVEARLALVTASDSRPGLRTVWLTGATRVDAVAGAAVATPGGGPEAAEACKEAPFMVALVTAVESLGVDSEWLTRGADGTDDEWWE